MFLSSKLLDYVAKKHFNKAFAAKSKEKKEFGRVNMSTKMRDELNNALKDALKSKEKVAMGTIRLILAAIKDRDIDARSSGKGDQIGDNEILSLMQSMIKQRQESSKTYREAGRPELAEREEEEITIIQRFLPKQMDENEMRSTVDELIKELNITDMREMGKVMAELKTRYAGQLDMSRASGVVKERLAG